MTKIDDITDMTALRAAIDVVDRELVTLLAQRHALISRAAQIKATQDLPADIPWRVEEVISNVRQIAARNGLDPDLIGSVWRQLVSAAIEQEERHLKESKT